MGPSRRELPVSKGRPAPPVARQSPMTLDRTQEVAGSSPASSMSEQETRISSGRSGRGEPKSGERGIRRLMEGQPRARHNRVVASIATRVRGELWR